MRGTSSPEQDRNNVPLGQIHTVTGGLTNEGNSALGRKAYARWVRYEEVFSVRRPPKQAQTHKTLVVSFDDVDYERVVYPHDDALVVTILVANYTTRMILVDKGSSTDILFWEVFSKIGTSQDMLRPSPTPPRGFSGKTVQPLGL